MATTYAYQKGKYGAPTGTIFPFFRDFVSVNLGDEDYTAYIPAGFLRCRGQILSANQFPGLAEVIGVGENCIYRKEGTTLQNPAADGSGGTIQLPDLGSKFLAAGTTAGQYNDLKLTSNNAVFKAGIEVQLTGAGNEIQFTYNGNFAIPSHPVTLFGSWTNTGLTSTSSSTVSEGQILAHGHFSNTTQLESGAKPNCGYAWKYIKCWGGGFAGLQKWCNCNSNATEVRATFNADIVTGGLEVEQVGTSTGTNHFHTNAAPSITSQSKSGVMQSRTFLASALQTTVRLNTATTVKIDGKSPKFMLCEFLIKI